MNIYAMKKPKRINSVSITVTLIVLVVGYLLWFLVPVYWPSFQMGGIMRGICNDAYRELDNKKLLDKLVESSRRTGLKITKENFRLTRVPYTPQELVALKQKSDGYWARRGKECVLEFYYEDAYPWPLIDKKTTFVFDKTISNTLEHVEY